jgi:deoxyribose-phosphate aldolase
MRKPEIITPTQLAKLIEHTLLRPDAKRQDIEILCREAVKYGFVAVCVNPVWIATAVNAVRGTGVRVGTVVAFPLGASMTSVKVYETRRAIDDGAAEIDVVMNVGDLKSNALDAVRHDIAAVVAECRQGSAASKVIIEVALLTDEEKRAASRIAKHAAADYVKTSTGFGPGGATAADVALIRETVGPLMGIKAAGGIRDLATVDAMIGAGATRIGTSAGVAILREAIEQAGRRGGG